MLRHAIVSLVVRCTRHAWATIIVATLLGVISGVYAAQHFAINTDINKLISPELGWRQREIAFEGWAAELAENPRVAESYLGLGATH